MKNFLIFFALFTSLMTYSQSIVGEWETYDDETNEKKGLIEIFKKGDTYFGKIKDTFVKENEKLCVPCKGEKHNKPIIGLTIIEDLKKEGDEFTDGTILDPENGKEYSCTLSLVSADKLRVRGYIGFSLLGRTQYWLRHK